MFAYTSGIQVLIPSRCVCVLCGLLSGFLHQSTDVCCSLINISKLPVVCEWLWECV